MYRTSNFHTYMLIDQQDRNILSLLCKLLKGVLDRRVLGLLVHYQVVLLRIRGLRDMLRNTLGWTLSIIVFESTYPDAGKQNTSDCVLPRCQ